MKNIKDLKQMIAEPASKEWFEKWSDKINEELEEYNNHDCHLSPEDSCPVCEKYYGRKF